MLLEELQQIKESTKDLKKFGLTLGIALIVLSAILFFVGKNSAVYFGVAGFVLVVAGFVAPSILKPFNRIWMIGAIILGWIMTRVILIILFYLVLTPIGLLAKIFNNDFLDQKFDASKSSYWSKKVRKKFDPLDYERQF